MAEFDGINEDEFCDKCREEKSGHFAHIDGEYTCEKCVCKMITAIANSKLREEQGGEK